MKTYNETSNFKDLELTSGLIKLTRQVEGQKDINLGSLFLVRSEMTIAKQIKSFCFAQGVDPNLGEIVIEEMGVCSSCNKSFTTCNLESIESELYCSKCFDQKESDLEFERLNSDSTFNQDQDTGVWINTGCNNNY